MKDAYSFDLDAAGLNKSFDLHDQVYRTIFTRCGLKFVAVEADSGAMGGSQSQEFMVYTDAGEDLIVSCPKCHYAANLEKAVSQLAPVAELDPTGDGKPELVSTPGIAAVADVAKFFNISEAQDIKCVAYMAETKKAKAESVWNPVVVFLRGDHQVNETKLLGLIKASDLRPMQAEELERYIHGPAGFLGPIGLVPAKVLGDEGVSVILDRALEARQNMVCGANRLDYHYRNVTPGRDFTWTIAADIRSVVEGEGCPQCGSPLKVAKAVEVGHIFKLGYKYSESMGARVLDPNGKEVTPIMGSYGIGIERILTAAIEQSNDANGFWLPRSIAPFEVVVTITNVTDATLLAAGERIAADLEAAGFDVLLDDREERAGVKFKDADLIGIPYRINVGKKVTEGKVEIATRSTASSEDVPISEVVAALQNTDC
jgi:prolyl-tRNA synthetase